jgi:hypothetical protein
LNKDPVKNGLPMIRLNKNNIIVRNNILWVIRLARGPVPSWHKGKAQDVSYARKGREDKERERVHQPELIFPHR